MFLLLCELVHRVVDQINARVIVYCNPSNFTKVISLVDGPQLCRHLFFMSIVRLVTRPQNIPTIKIIPIAVKLKIMK